MKLFFGILFIGVYTLVNGQYNEPKFGKVDIADLQMTRYEKDTSAAALILFDNGFSEFELNGEGQFQHRYVRHYMIKIFKKTALSLADKKIALYRSGSSEEVIYNINAATYNLADGKVVKSKLDNSSIFRENTNNYVIKTFAMPDVKEGSIIEVSYTIISDFLYNFRGWDFQNYYPIVWSQYRFVIPEYFSYNQMSKGFLKFDVYDRKQGFVTYAQNDNKTTSTTETTIAIKDVPAFVSEPNIDCEDNYIQSIEFELSSVQYPGAIRKDFTRTWESVNKQMNDDEDFGYLLKTSGFVKDTVENICLNKSSEFDKAVGIFNYLQKRMEWNNRYSIWANNGLKKPFNERLGNSTEINLLLTLMLQTAGLKADPVLISTRDNGFTKTYSPTITKFNSVLSKLEIDGKVYLLDATSKFCPFGVLPLNDINGSGRVVNNTMGDWVSLETPEKYREIKSYSLNLSPEGIFTGLVLGRYDGYGAIAYRTNLSLEKSKDDYIRKIQEHEQGLTINNYCITNTDNIYLPVIDTFNVEIADHAEIIADKIMFKPLLLEAIGKNIYTLEERKFPVDYNNLISENYIFEYTIPDGYEVESLPKSVSIKMADNSANILYALQNTGNKIKVVYRRNINKRVFSSEEYGDLKEFYDQMVRMHAEQIILKKIV